MKVWVHFILVTTGILVLVAAFLLRQKFPHIMSKQLAAKLIISPDSPTIDSFISPPIPIYMQFYFFNVTNPRSILEGGKPKVKEIGPYTYLEKRFKHDLNWTGSTVSYKDKTTFIFQPKLSKGLTEDDIITTLNPVLITMAAKLDSPSVPELMHGLFEMIKRRFDMKAFITRKVGELLFKGYEEDLLLELYKLTNNPLHKTGRFGFFYPKNNTDGGEYSIFTGVDGLETLQVISTWKNNTELDYWPEKRCNMINGTTGSQFPQPIVPARNISMFSADLCRSLYLAFEKKVYSGDLELLRFTLPYEVLSDRPENHCYCSDNFTCKASLVNLAPCRGGAPVVASTPHFYMGDEDLVSAVEGLNPSKEHHDTYLDIEPNTGVSFEAMKRIQLSMPLKRYADLPELANVKEVILPLLWLNESAKVPEARAQALHVKLTKPITLVNLVCLVLNIIGGVLIALPIIFTMVHKWKKTRNNKSQKEKKEDKEIETLNANGQNSKTLDASQEESETATLQNKQHE